MFNVVVGGCALGQREGSNLATRVPLTRAGCELNLGQVVVKGGKFESPWAATLDFGFSDGFWS